MSVIQATRTGTFERTDPRAARRAIRAGAYAAQTAGIAPGYVQGNLCILPRDYAHDFFVYCQRNPKPCPLLAASDPGDPRLPALGEDLDIRTDVPSYRVFRDGEYVEDVADIRELWRGDLVAFVLGCSFSFEEALIEAGVPLRHIAEGKGVPMYLTNIETAPAGPFRGGMVVSMRPFPPSDAIRAVQITTRFPSVHGAPVRVVTPDRYGYKNTKWVAEINLVAKPQPGYWEQLGYDQDAWVGRSNGYGS